MSSINKINIAANQFQINQIETQTNQPPVNQESTDTTANPLSNQTVIQTPLEDQTSTNQLSTNQTAARRPQTNQPPSVDQLSKNITDNQLPTNQHHFDKGPETGQMATEGIIKFSVVHT